MGDKIDVMTTASNSDINICKIVDHGKNIKNIGRYEVWVANFSGRFPKGRSRKRCKTKKEVNLFLVDEFYFNE